MFENIKKDFDRYCQIDYGMSGENCHNRLRVWLNSYGLQVLTAYRFYCWCREGRSRFEKNCKLPLCLVAVFLHKLVGKMYDIKIFSGVDLRPGCYIGHFGGIRLRNCRIGSLCNINHQVQIGSNDTNVENKIHIEDRVWIGAHTKIYGNLMVGTGAAISAGSIVTGDVESQTLVAGPKARLLKKNYDNSHLLGLVEKL